MRRRLRDLNTPTRVVQRRRRRHPTVVPLTLAQDQTPVVNQVQHQFNTLGILNRLLKTMNRKVARVPQVQSTERHRASPR